MVDDGDPARKSFGTAPLLAGAGVLGLAVLAAGGWFVYRQLTFWDRDHPLEQAQVFDDDAALVRQDDAPSHRIRVSRVDGHGARSWATVVDLHPDAAPTETLVIPVPAAHVATVGTLVGLSLDDGHEIWRHPGPERAARCRSYGVDEEWVVAQCEGVVLGIHAPSGREGWRIPWSGRFRWFASGAGTIALDHDDATTGVVVDLATGKTRPLTGRICETDGLRLSLEPNRVTVEDLVDPTKRRSAELAVADVPAARCGARGDTLFVGRGTLNEAVLHAIDRQSLALKWSLRIPVTVPTSASCIQGSYLDLDGALPKLVPIRVGGTIHLVDVDAGAIAARYDPPFPGGCLSGVEVRDGRAYEVGEHDIKLFDPNVPRAHVVELNSWRTPSFSKSFLWVVQEAHVGRLGLSDLRPAPGGEWLAGAVQDVVFPAAPAPPAPAPAPAPQAPSAAPSGPASGK